MILSHIFARLMTSTVISGRRIVCRQGGVPTCRSYQRSSDADEVLKPATTSRSRRQRSIYFRTGASLVLSAIGLGAYAGNGFLEDLVTNPIGTVTSGSSNIMDHLFFRSAINNFQGAASD